jgi:hypothetical protein
MRSVSGTPRGFGSPARTQILTLGAMPSGQMRLLILILTILAYQIDLYGQKKDVHETRIPKNTKQCFATLDKTMPDNEIELIRTLHEDSIYDHNEFKYGTDFFHAWKLYDGSTLTKYFNKMGLVGSHEIYETILVSYHRHLNNKELDLNGQIKKYQAIQKSDYEYYLSKLDQDSLNNIYIPKDINECMTELDRLLDNESKDKFISQEESKAVSSAYRPGVGLSIRNNWGLWGGSRLQKYFFDKGAKDPEGISWIILTCYHRHLNGKPLDFEGQLKSNKD